MKGHPGLPFLLRQIGRLSWRPGTAFLRVTASEHEKETDPQETLTVVGSDPQIEARPLFSIMVYFL